MADALLAPIGDSAIPAAIDMARMDFFTNPPEHY
jgi:hypothetical protein